ncbi:MAG TPA: hypothetical protein VNA04_00270 [Thermoanaerobaculia bacterium]|nr:hypothetical protein [Thermoanaerobaculia bacterium]
MRRPALAALSMAVLLAGGALSAAETGKSVLRCGIDQGKDRVCGPRPGSLSGTPAAACPSSPATLDLRLYQPVVFSDPRPGDEELIRLGYPGFVFELERTREYPREQAQGGFRSHGPIPLVECCYVKCTEIDVAAKGGSDGSRLGFCMDPLTGGTSFPARGAPDCPRAVKVGGAYRAFSEKSESGACCYAMPPPPPPKR